MRKNEVDLLEAMDLLDVPEDVLGGWLSKENSNRGAEGMNDLFFARRD